MTEKTIEIPQIEALRDRLQGQQDVDSIVATHQTILENPQALMRYAKLSQAVYYDGSEVSEKLPVGCQVIKSSVRSDTWFLDGLQAMCVSCPQAGELIVAYRGTEKSNPADLITDGGAIATLCSFTGDDIIRTVIYREMVEKTWANFAVANAAKATLAGQIAGRLVNAMKYYQTLAEQLNFAQYSKITIVGHSLGGLIAAHVAYWANEKYGREINCHTFNSAPGVKYTLVDSGAKCDRAIANRIINHRIIEDSVSGPLIPTGLNEAGFPYAHMGYIYNWQPLERDTYLSFAVHSLDRFIKDLKFETKHLVGIAPAPVAKIYW